MAVAFGELIDQLLDAGSGLGDGPRVKSPTSMMAWFSDNKEWIEFIAAAVVLWLLMMTGVAVFDLRSAA